jgi:lysophospholipase L1-like esterase
LFLPALSQPAARAVAATPDQAGAWESSIVAFEQGDRLHPPPSHAALFIGSSTIVRWKSLAGDFPGVPVLNRGFGGCQISDINRYAKRIIFPYAPDRIFLRAGTNDLHAGKTAAQVFDDFKTLAESIRAELPAAEFYYIALSPSISRRVETDATKQLNGMIRDYMAGIPNFKYVDAWSVTLDERGNLRADLFLPDKLHLNAHGYKILAERVRPYLEPPRAVAAGFVHSGKTTAPASLSGSTL